MSDKTKRVFFGLVSFGFAIGTFILADMAMPEEVKWFMRWWLAGVALVCYSAGAAYAAYLMQNDHADAIKEKEATIAGKQAALDNEKRKNAKLAAILDERKRQEREQAQRDEDADRLLKLTMAEYKVIDGILVAAAQGKEYRRSYNTAIGDLYGQGVIESLDDGKTYVIRMKLRPFFEKYADAIHEIANGANEDRLRIARLVRDGGYFQMSTGSLTERGV